MSKKKVKAPELNTGGVIRMWENVLGKDVNVPKHNTTCPKCDRPTTNFTKYASRKPKACDRCVCLVSILNNYNITSVEYDTMWDDQNGCCAICNRELSGGVNKVNKTATDHCHIYMHIRGLLCYPCNSGLGHFRDNASILRNAIKYLEENEFNRSWWFQKGINELEGKTRRDERETRGEARDITIHSIVEREELEMSEMFEETW